MPLAAKWFWCLKDQMITTPYRTRSFYLPLPALPFPGSKDLFILRIAWRVEDSKLRHYCFPFYSLDKANITSPSSCSHCSCRRSLVFFLHWSNWQKAHHVWGSKCTRIMGCNCLMLVGLASEQTCVRLGFYSVLAIHWIHPSIHSLLYLYMFIPVIWWDVCTGISSHFRNSLWNSIFYFVTIGWLNCKALLHESWGTCTVIMPSKGDFISGFLCKHLLPYSTILAKLPRGFWLATVKIWGWN